MLRSLCFVFALTFCFAVVFGGNTVNAPFPQQVNDQTLQSSVKFTNYDMPSNTKINDMIVTVTYYISQGGPCLSASSSNQVDDLNEFGFQLLLTDNQGNPIGGVQDFLSPAGNYADRPTPVTIANSLIVQTFKTSAGSIISNTLVPAAGENWIENQKYPSTGYYVPRRGFLDFKGQTIRDRLFRLVMVDTTADNTYLCFSQFEVTINCPSRAVIYKPTLTIQTIAPASTSTFLTSSIQPTTQQYFPLQSTITTVTATLAWTKTSLNGGTCDPGNLSGIGDRHLEDISVVLKFASLKLASPISITLVAQNSWKSFTNSTEANYFSTTFDSTSINFYPKSITGGTIQPYQSLSAFNGLSPWGTWTIEVSNANSAAGTFPICVFGARVAISTCSVNQNCMCGDQELSPGTNTGINGQIGITTTNTV